jgi:uracil-DNA glycosylase
MPHTLDPELRRALTARIRFYNEMGIYDFYRRPPADEAPLAADEMAIAASIDQPESGEEMSPRKATAVAVPVEEDMSDVIAMKPEQRVSDPVKALKIIREDLGDCKRCVLHKQGRKQIVFGVGDPKAELMFIGEGPGADEDEKGEPFVGRAGQLLNNMIKAMGIEREQVYIANIVKCRPPQNRVPEPEEANTCSPFLFQQIDVVRPQVIVALGSTAATYLLGVKSSLSGLRGRLHACRGTKLVVTYHPAYLLRDPRQKKEAWQDLKLAMSELGLSVPSR